MIIIQLDSEQLSTLIKNSVGSLLEEKLNSPKKVDQELLTIKQAAMFLNLTASTIYTLVSKSEIPVCKKGKRLYFQKHDLIKWISSGRKRTNAELAEAANLIRKSKHQ